VPRAYFVGVVRRRPSDALYRRERRKQKRARWLASLTADELALHLSNRKVYGRSHFERLKQRRVEPIAKTPIAASVYLRPGALVDALLGRDRAWHLGGSPCSSPTMLPPR
jgi:hypothetical protein